MEFSDDQRNWLFAFNKNNTSKYKTRVWLYNHFSLINFKNNEFSRNVFLTKDNNVKLGDLGSTRSKSDESTARSKYAGFFAYMSPEMMGNRIMFGNKRYSFKTDVW